MKFKGKGTVDLAVMGCHCEHGSVKVRKILVASLLSSVCGIGKTGENWQMYENQK